MHRRVRFIHDVVFLFRFRYRMPFPAPPLPRWSTWRAAELQPPPPPHLVCRAGRRHFPSPPLHRPGSPFASPKEAETPLALCLSRSQSYSVGSREKTRVARLPRLCVVARTRVCFTSRGWECHRPSSHNGRTRMEVGQGTSDLRCNSGH